ncbi:hypothetical protein B0E50_08075 [Rhodanobacter sp. C01]|nr:hypothetical protein B0E50_08075 [Rhodanobacter sp. C01]
MVRAVLCKARRGERLHVFLLTIGALFMTVLSTPLCLALPAVFPLLARANNSTTANAVTDACG